MLTDVLRLSAREAVRLLRAGELHPRDLLEAALTRIAQVEAKVNALPTLCAERARSALQRLSEGRRDHPAWLAGLPIAVKDLTDVAGVRTTYGSTIYADHVPERSDILVERLEERGAIVIAKSNTPEFGAGANTFNEVFGKTRNPWDLSRTSGGSSGGSAVALACGEVWLATGSDLGGSLRIPASYCGVVGLRPSPGRVAHGPAPLPFDTLSVNGPMGRSVGDVALLLDAMCGHHPEDPLSFDAPARPFVEAVDRPRLPERMAYAPDLGGIMPVSRAVRDVCDAAARRFEALGVRVEEVSPDLSDAREIFQTLRAAGFAERMSPLLAEHRHALKPEVVWNIEAGCRLSAEDIGRAERARGALYARVAAFFERYPILLAPAVIVPPFDVDVRYVDQVEGRRFDNYVDWLIATYAITLAASPALSLPCGFTAEGLPVGLQMIGPPRGEAPLLSAAAAFEADAGLAALVPIDPGGVHGL